MGNKLLMYVVTVATLVLLVQVSFAINRSILISNENLFFLYDAARSNQRRVLEVKRNLMQRDEKPGNSSENYEKDAATKKSASVPIAHQTSSQFKRPLVTANVPITMNRSKKKYYLTKRQGL